jgi:hypothetical protein
MLAPTIVGDVERGRGRGRRARWNQRARARSSTGAGRRRRGPAQSSAGAGAVEHRRGRAVPDVARLAYARQRPRAGGAVGPPQRWAVVLKRTLCAACAQPSRRMIEETPMLQTGRMVGVAGGGSGWMGRTSRRSASRNMWIFSSSDLAGPAWEPRCLHKGADT